MKNKFIITLFIFAAFIFSSCKNQDPAEKICSLRNSYSVEIVSLKKKPDTNEFIIELNIVSNSKETLQYLTVRFNEYDQNDKMANYFRYPVDVAGIKSRSSSLRRITISASSPSVSGLTCFIEKYPSENDRSSMKEFKSLNLNP